MEHEKELLLENIYKITKKKYFVSINMIPLRSIATVWHLKLRNTNSTLTISLTCNNAKPSLICVLFPSFEIASWTAQSVRILFPVLLPATHVSGAFSRSLRLCRCYNVPLLDIFRSAFLLSFKHKKSYLLSPPT